MKWVSQTPTKYLNTILRKAQPNLFRLAEIKGRTKKKQSRKDGGTGFKNYVIVQYDLKKNVLKFHPAV